MGKFNMKWQKQEEPFSKSTLFENVKGEEMKSVSTFFICFGVEGVGVF